MNIQDMQHRTVISLGNASKSSGWASLLVRSVIYHRNNYEFAVKLRIRSRQLNIHYSYLYVHVFELLFMLSNLSFARVQASNDACSL